MADLRRDIEYVRQRIMEHIEGSESARNDPDCVDDFSAAALRLLPYTERGLRAEKALREPRDCAARAVELLGYVATNGGDILHALLAALRREVYGE